MTDDEPAVYIRGQQGYKLRLKPMSPPKCPRCKGTGYDRTRRKGIVGGWTEKRLCQWCNGTGRELQSAHLGL